MPRARAPTTSMRSEDSASHSLDDEILAFEDDAEGPSPERSGGYWSLLVVDDDPDVHDATTFALSTLEVQGRRFRILHAYSAREALEILSRERDVAAILLDVVMETEDAGLRLVSDIRHELGLRDTRIILRTGQPGYAPELDAIRDYDINDYKTKSELTQARLFATLMTAVRSYEQIRMLDENRRGLGLVVSTTTDVLGLPGPKEFTQVVLPRFAELLGGGDEGLAATRMVDERGEVYQTLAAGGRYEPSKDRPLDPQMDPRAFEIVHQAFHSGHPIYGERFAAVPLLSRSGEPLVVFADRTRPLDEVSRRLVDLFGASLSVSLENVFLVRKLRTAAFVDPLCDIPNRTGLVVHLDQILRSEERADAVLALVDLDLFSEVNDALGHRFGDALLRRVAHRLGEAFGHAATVSRVASDVFGVVGPETVVTPTAIAEALARPFQVDGVDTDVSATLGLVRLAESEGDGADALKQANIALDRAKDQRRGHHCYFTREMSVEIEERVSLLHALRSAMQSEELHLVYQPQIDMRTGRILGAEALIRWTHPSGRSIPPDRFIPIAERSGLVVPIGAFVLERACLTKKRLSALGYPDFRMSVNVSMSQFRHPLFLEVLESTLASTGVDPATIELEITESMAMEDSTLLVDRLEAIKKLGCTIAIDDFGTGFSSLSYLHRLRVDRLKIDRSFVRSLRVEAAGEHIASTIIELARALGLRVIAEGVETHEQNAALAAMGCDEAQGYLFSPPIAESALRVLLEAERTGLEASPE